ncbi:MAG: hypothetical protein CSA07_00715 [Bacteroidia bacterium]|nr:MAG: hypothetical protein CSA07_00715 [Bacteroidia bacterium]
MGSSLRPALRLLGLLLLLPALGVAQDKPSDGRNAADEASELKTVEVSRAYEPKVEDAEKTNFIPPLDDTVVPAPVFTYSLIQRPVHSLITLRPLPAARMGDEAPEELSNWYLRLGFGNYLSPLGELYYSSDQGKHFTLGAHLRHASDWGKVKLRGDEDAPAKHSDTRLGIFGDGVAWGHGMHGRFDYRHAYDNFYGRLDKTAGGGGELFLKGTGANTFNGEWRMNTLHMDSSHVHYDGRFRLGGYVDSRDASVVVVDASFAGHKYLHSEALGGQVRIRHFGTKVGSKSRGNTIFSLYPWVKIFGERWRAWAGIDLTIEGNNGKTFFHFFPHGHVSLDVIKQYMIPYFEVDSELEVADYQSLRAANPWLRPGLFVWNSPRLLELRFGVKGNLNTSLSYNVSGSFAVVDSVHVFVNGLTPAGGYSSDFVVEQDKGQELHLNGEMEYAFGRKFRLYARGDWWHYKLDKQPIAWHRPTYRLSLNGRYNLRRKIEGSLDLFLEGGRKARALDGSAIPLRAFPNLNLGFRYQFSDLFGLFVDLRNLLFWQHEVYYLYPGHRFQALLGVSLNF